MLLPSNISSSARLTNGINARSRMCQILLIAYPFFAFGQWSQRY